LLNEHKVGLVQLAEQLLEKEVIFTEDLEKIFGKRKGKMPDMPEKPKKERKSPKRVKPAKSGEEGLEVKQSA